MFRGRSGDPQQTELESTPVAARDWSCAKAIDCKEMPGNFRGWQKSFIPWSWSWLHNWKYLSKTHWILYLKLVIVYVSYITTELSINQAAKSLVALRCLEATSVFAVITSGLIHWIIYIYVCVCVCLCVYILLFIVFRNFPFLVLEAPCKTPLRIIDGAWRIFQVHFLSP